MALVFKHAYATIGADIGQDGCFAPVPAQFYPRKLTLPHPLDENYSYSTYVRKSGYEKHVPGPLSGRGWIFQERILASRFIWCKPAEIIVDCFEDTRCQCTAETQVSRGPRNWTNGDLSRTLVQGVYDNANTLWIDNLEKAIHSSWRTAVQNFSQCRLTYEKDIFPALSGLAKAARTDHVDKYVAGLWTDDLVRGLMWTRDSDSVKALGATGRPTIWRAPTWSRASILHPCRYETSFANGIQLDGDLDIKVSKLEAKVLLGGTDPTGEITKGHLTVSGRIVEGRISYRDDLSYVTLEIRQQSSNAPNELSTIHGQWKLARHRLDYDIQHPGPSHIPSGSQVAILLWVRGWVQDDHFALILRRKALSNGAVASPVYERIGHCGNTLSADEGHDVDCPCQGNMFNPDFCSGTCRALREGNLWKDVTAMTITIV